MRKFVCTIVFIIAFIGVAVSQNSPEYYLRRCPYLSPNMEKMIGISVADSTFYDNISKITENKSGNQITIRTSKISTISVNVLKMVNNSDLVAMIFNIEYPTKSSLISFYDKDMCLLPSNKIIENIDINAIVNNLSCDDNTKNRIQQLISPLHVSYIFDNEKLKAEIIFPTTVEDEGNRKLMDEIENIKQYTYVWNSSKYILKK